MKFGSYFTLAEFVPKDIYTKWGDSSLWFVDQRLINSIIWLREQLGEPLVINNWATGGSHQNRCFRPPGNTVGASLSQHRFGRAADFDSPDMKVSEIYKWLISNQEKVVKETSFTTIEDLAHTPTWIHLDCRARPGAKSLLIVQP